MKNEIPPEQLKHALEHVDDPIPEGDILEEIENARRYFFTQWINTIHPYNHDGGEVELTEQLVPKKFMMLNDVGEETSETQDIWGYLHRYGNMDMLEEPDYRNFVSQFVQNVTAKLPLLLIDSVVVEQTEDGFRSFFQV